MAESRRDQCDRGTMLGLLVRQTFETGHHSVWVASQKAKVDMRRFDFERGTTTCLFQIIVHGLFPGQEIARPYWMRHRAHGIGVIQPLNDCTFTILRATKHNVYCINTTPHFVGPGEDHGAN